MRKIFDIYTWAHFLAGGITALCLLNPDIPLAILTSILCFASFLIYEYWEDQELSDRGFRDWWEFMAAYMTGITIIQVI